VWRKGEARGEEVVDVKQVWGGIVEMWERYNR